jgi:nicotinate (nicotinamide) nucleotide adenylyltransferase
MARIALYGGAFDPPHMAHAFAVTWLLSQVDAVWLVPTGEHAFGKRMVPFAQRVEMLRLSLRHFEPKRVDVCTIESERAGPSLTFDTLSALSARHPEHTFHWVIGADNLTEAHRWHRFDELVATWRMFVLGRPGHEAALARFERAPWAIIGPTLPDVSSSALRAALAGEGSPEALRWIDPEVAAAARPLYDLPGAGLPPVFLVGDGNVARALRVALAAARIPVAGQWARRDGPLPARLTGAGVVVLCVTDAAVSSVAARLARETEFEPGTTVLHCAARLGVEVLSPLANRGLHLGSLHPLQSLREPDRAANLLRGAFFGIEGESEARLVATRLARAMGGRPVEVPAGGKPAYHAAAVFSGNFAVTLMAGGVALLESLGFDEAQARGLLLPLLRGTLANLDAGPAQNALTGPFARGDLGAVRAHVEALGERAPEFLEAYRALARATAGWLGWSPARVAALEAALMQTQIPDSEESPP